ncbi:MAG: prepilin-type N-terminal cleavage/methylation domain-containing protein [Oligoflexia bacterium]|nr:prepilin-type N-terminal cleavage/methylation domain-containing protein [Oligoflexia bacterium]
MATKHGFTLIEILIAILILAFMSSMTAISIQRSIKIKSKVEKEIDDDSQLRETVALLVKDINLAFQWVDVNELVKNQIVKEYKAQGKPSPFGEPVPNLAPVVPLEKLTFFEGTSDSLKFTTLSNERIIKNSKESDQAVVNYYLKNVRSYKDKKMSQGLVKSISTILDGDLEKKGKETVLIENVKSLNFRFLPSDITELSDSSWMSSWKSFETLDEKTLAKFPAAVEINIVVERDGRKSAITTVAALNMIGEPIKLAEPKAPVPATPPAPSTGGTNR